MIYRRLVAPLLFALPAETAHVFAFRALRWTLALPGARRLVAAGAPDPALEVEALGLRFPTPIGLAAGFDKDALGFEALSALGFGFVEVGTLTARAQPGNPRPRLFRLRRDRALVNRLGFNNRGAAEAVARLARPRRALVGVNVGKSASASAADAIRDYEESVRLLAPRADYLAVNVSSPNTPGLRDLQAVERLRPLLAAVQAAARAAAGRRVPVLVKVAPDLADEELDQIADLALELGLDGIIATNTTIARTNLATDAQDVARLGAGGLSGAPLGARALEVLRRLAQRTRGRVVLVAVGGIATVDDVWQRLAAGATLVQLYTAFVYEGPALPRRLARGLAQRLRRAGLERVRDLVGLDARAPGSAGAGARAGEPSALA